jgi:hypothetical protein
LGKLSGHKQFLLATGMTVHPSGIGKLSNWIFTTSTNRSQKTLEVLGAYKGSTSDLDIFDWSCSTANPCETKTSPSYVYIKSLSSLSCYYATESDGGGHTQSIIHYQNRSTVVQAGTPPLWQNSALLHNHCRNTWDTVYQHRFRVAQHNCALDNSCAWWGPILETFIATPEPPIKELGFQNSTLTVDGVTSKLLPTNTSFVAVFPPWKLFFRFPNYTWGAGSTIH